MSGADMALPQALGLEADLNVILQSTRDRAEGISSFPGAAGAGFHRGVSDLDCCPIMKGVAGRVGPVTQE